MSGMPQFGTKQQEASTIEYDCCIVNGMKREKQTQVSSSDVCVVKFNFVFYKIKVK